MFLCFLTLDNCLHKKKNWETNTNVRRCHEEIIPSRTVILLYLSKDIQCHLISINTDPQKWVHSLCLDATIRLPDPWGVKIKLTQNFNPFKRHFCELICLFEGFCVCIFVTFTKWWCCNVMGRPPQHYLIEIEI